MKKTKKKLVEQWIEKHDMCGENPWWDEKNTYYNLTVKQIVSIANYLNKQS